MKTWIFQANPDLFDVDTYLENVSYAYWSVPVEKYCSELQVGDYAFIWRAGGKEKAESGVVAFGTVVEECKHKSEIRYKGNLGEELLKQGEQEKSEYQVGVEIQEYRLSLSEGMIPRHTVEDDDTLKTMRVITVQAGTIFPLNEEQGFRLYTLWNEFKSVYPIKSFSFTILSDSVYIKTIDKSTLFNRGTAIPSNILSYFGIGEGVTESNRNTTLIYKNQRYSGHFQVDPQERVRLFWENNFSVALREEIPEWARIFEDDLENPVEPPILRFEKDKNAYNTYNIEIVLPGRVAEDIESDIIEEKGPDKVQKSEGSVKWYYGKTYERVPENRREAIEIHGTTCQVCGFDFEEHYGPRGKGFIEVHHIKPISTFESAQMVDPGTDMICVCSNCHRMIHRDSKNVLSISEMKLLIDN